MVSKYVGEFIDDKGFIVASGKQMYDPKLAQSIKLAMNPVDYFYIGEIDGVPTGDAFVFDIESYPNFFYIAFKHMKTGKVIDFEDSPDCRIDSGRLASMMWRFCIIGFNSLNYDVPLLCMAATGRYNYEHFYEVTVDLIVKNVQVWTIERKYNFSIPKKLNHVDLIEVCPLIASLKSYAGRLHCKRMQDLPFPPGTLLTREQAQYVKNYCANDLDNTALVCIELKEQLRLRAELSDRYSINLMSKSDAQIAEAVISAEVAKIKGYHTKKPAVDYDAEFKYHVPDFITYSTNRLNDMLRMVGNATFLLDGAGRPKMPPELSNFKVGIGGSVYKMGMGGLHSQEKNAAHRATDEINIDEDDVASFYPRTIINQKLFPKHLGEAFLIVYEVLVNDRLKAKGLSKAEDLTIAERMQIAADALKIVINGSFGKLGSPYSLLYAPDLMLQVTITGQLVLLMLINRLEDAGISVISANTDGIVTKYHKSLYETKRRIIKQWEAETNYETEEAKYAALYSRDINNYIAVKLDDKGNIKGTKNKGAYKNPWADKKEAIFRFHKNPETTVCIEAVTNFLTTGQPIEDFIRGCDDIRKFVAVRNSSEGAYKVMKRQPPPAHNSKEELLQLAGWTYDAGSKQLVKGNFEEAMPYSDGAVDSLYARALVDLATPDGLLYLGKAIRWYYAVGEKGCINAVKNGAKIPKSDGAKPCMDLPDKLPSDVNYAWYIKEANDILVDIGYYRTAKTLSFF